MNDLNLNNPIFVYYLYTKNKPPLRVDEDIRVIRESLSYQNITLWIIPVYETDSKIECVYNGLYKSDFIKRIIDSINDISIEYPEISNDIKSKIRNIILDELL